jgi:hypothetical protein
LDVDHKTGKSIAIICNNKRTVSKCCEKTQKLLKSEKGVYQCEDTKEAIYLNDLADVLWKSEKTKPNIEYKVQSYSQFQNIEIIRNYSIDQFEFDKNQTVTKFKDNSNFCLDKFEDSWIVFTSNLIPIYNTYIATFSTISLVAILIAVLLIRVSFFEIENYLLWIYTICLFVALLMEAISALADINLVLPRDIFFAGSFCTLPLILFLKFFDGTKTALKAIYLSAVNLVLVISVIFITLSHSLENFIGELSSI